MLILTGLGVEVITKAYCLGDRFDFLFRGYQILPVVAQWSPIVVLIAIEYLLSSFEVVLGVDADGHNIEELAEVILDGPQSIDEAR